jgi:hypothetical protein
MLVGLAYKHIIDSLFTKSVVMVWKNSIYFNEPNSYWGFGDIIRGVIWLFQLSQKYKFNLIVDWSHHTVSNCLKHTFRHMYSEQVANEQTDIPFIGNSEAFIVNNLLLNTNREYICMLTNGPLEAYSQPVTPELYKFVDSLLQPTESILERLPTFKYSIVHYRLGDEERRTNGNTEQYANICRTFNFDITNTILISDSMNFKKYVQQNHSQIKLFQTTVKHLGYETTDIEDTMFEFFLLKSADKITSFTTYGWISGFVHAVSYLYNIPLLAYIHCNF